MKKVVKYWDLESPLVLGLSAYCRTEGHPSPYVTPGRVIRSTPVIRIDSSGEFETKNTIYTPRETS